MFLTGEEAQILDIFLSMNEPKEVVLFTTPELAFLMSVIPTWIHSPTDISIKGSKDVQRPKVIWSYTV